MADNSDSLEVDCSIFVEKFKFAGDVVVTGKIIKKYIFYLYW